MNVTVEQIHTGTIVQRDIYEIPDWRWGEYESASSKEYWLTQLSGLLPVASSIEPDEIDQTIQVSVIPEV